MRLFPSLEDDVPEWKYRPAPSSERIKELIDDVCVAHVDGHSIFDLVIGDDPLLDKLTNRDLSHKEPHMPESPAPPYRPTPHLVRNSPEAIADFLLYGDIEEMPLNVLGEDEPTIEQLDTMNDEQRIRRACAACVLAWLKGRLTIGGHLVTEEKGASDAAGT